MVPEGWSELALGRLINDSAFGPRFSSSLYSDDGAIGTIRTTDLSDNGDINYSTIPYADLDENQYRDHILREGDLLITRSGTCGIATIFIKQSKPIVAGAFLIRFQLNDRADPLFLHAVLMSSAVQEKIRRMAAGGVQKNLTGTSLKKLKLFIPPLPEQHKIAKILQTWDRAIATTEKLIDASKQQKKALMQQLLTGKKRFAGFEGEWEEVRLDEICQINPRKSIEPDDGLVSFITMDDVSSDALLLRKRTRTYKEVNSGFTSFIDKDVLVAKITPCFENGKGAHVANLKNGIGFGSTEFHVLRARSDISSNFVYFLTTTYEFRSRGEINMQGSAGQKRVTTDYLRIFKVKIPASLKEQKQVVSVFAASDKSLEILKEKLTHLKQEKKALMQQLLTGKRRVKVDAL